MRAASPKLRAAWVLLVGALGVLAGLALSRPASGADACFRLTEQVGGITAAASVFPEDEPRAPVARGPVVAHDTEARLVELDHGQWAERTGGRAPRTLPEAAGAHKRDTGGLPDGLAASRVWGLSVDLESAGVAVEVANRAARTSDARNGARARSVHAPRGPPEKPFA